ncbi:hypothetical protein ES705_14967 [subsurface metagenome]
MENKKAKLTPEELEDFKQFIRTLDEKKLNNWKEYIRIIEKYLKEYLKDGKLTDFENWILNSTPEDIRNLEILLDEKPIKPKFIRQSMHSVKQGIGTQGEPSIFDDELPNKYCKDFGIEKINEIDKYGMNLNVTQKKLMYGILKAFTETDYKGNTDSRSVEEIMEEHKVFTPDKLPKAHKIIKEIPVIQIGQRELLRLSGIDKNIRSSAQEGIKALGYLGTYQYCFYWDRLAYKDGQPEKDSEGDYKKEEVMAVDTLFKVKVVIDKKTKEFKHYEISPSVVFLDQIKNYFLLIPYNFMEETQKLVGKRANSYLFKLLEFLRYQYEEIRRYNKGHKDKKLYTIGYSWETMAKKIKMPETIYKRKRVRALKILDEVYQTAQDLDYLISYERTATVDVLELNPDRYPSPLELDDK